MKVIHKVTVMNILKMPLLRNTLFGCILIVTVLPVYSIFFVYPAFTKLLVESIEADALKVGWHLARMIVPEDGKLTRDGISAGSKAEIGIAKNEFGLEKLKIFSDSGEVIYSSDPEEIGVMNERDYFRGIVAKGKAYTHVVQRRGRTLEDRVVSSDVVETYVPLLRNDHFVGAFEIYYDITAKKGRLDKLLLHSVDFLLAIAGGLLIAVMVILLKASRTAIERERVEEERKKLIQELREALAKIKTFRGLIPICAACKKIRDDKGYWNQLETYIRDHSDAEFSHSICPGCSRRLYPELFEKS